MLKVLRALAGWPSSERVHALWDVYKAAWFALLGVLGKLVSEAATWQIF